MTLPSTAHDARPVEAPAAAVSLRGARLPFGERTLWQRPRPRRRAGRVRRRPRAERVGQDLAATGPARAAAAVGGRGRVGRRAEPRRGSPTSATSRSRRRSTRDLPLRGRDLVGLGLDGHRLGHRPARARARRAQVDAALAAVDGTELRRRPRRVASPAASSSGCGWPRRWSATRPCCSATSRCSRSTWPTSAGVTALIDRRRRSTDTAVVFVTHEINPVLPLVDRVLYLVDGRFRIGHAGRGHDLRSALGSSTARGRRAARARPAGRRGRRGRDAAHLHGDDL